jgi:hypothetical protein
LVAYKRRKTEKSEAEVMERNKLWSCMNLIFSFPILLKFVFGRLMNKWKLRRHRKEKLQTNNRSLLSKLIKLIRSNVKTWKERAVFNTLTDCNYIQQHKVQRTEIERIVFSTLIDCNHLHHHKVQRTEHLLHVLPPKRLTSCLEPLLTTLALEGEQS